MHFHFLLWILTRKCHSLHITVFCTCFDGFFSSDSMFFFQLLNPGGRQWGQLQLPVHLRQEKQRLLLLCRHGGRQGDLWARESFSVSFFLLTMITTTIKMFISCTPCVLLVKLVFPFLSPDRIPTQIWNHKIVDATTPVSHQHWLDTNILINYTSSRALTFFSLFAWKAADLTFLLSSSLATMSYLVHPVSLARSPMEQNFLCAFILRTLRACGITILFLWS